MYHLCGEWITTQGMGIVGHCLPLPPARSGESNPGTSLKHRVAIISPTRRQGPTGAELRSSQSDNSMKVDSIAMEAAFDDLVDQAGGSWPPQSVFEGQWPHGLQLYATICDRASQRFAFPPPEEQKENTSELLPLSDNIDMKKCPFAQLAKKSRPVEGSIALAGSSPENKVLNFRQWLKAECTKLPSSTEVMDMVRGLDQQQRNGFVCCLGFLLHMYRWGTCPVVEFAQLETTMAFPEHLWKPFEFLSRNLGMSLSGTVYNLYYCNAIRDANGDFQRFRFSFIDKQRMPAIHVTEVNKQKMLLEMAAAGKHLFENMIDCMRCVEGGHEREAVIFLRAVRELSCKIYKLFAHWMQDEFIAYEYWMRYVQGPGGWGIDGEDGLTGAHTLAIPAMDAFLGIQGKSSTWEFTLKHRSHMTSSMRSFLEKLEAFDLISFVKSGKFTNPEFLEEYELCVRRLRGFRIAHKYRVLPYFGIKAPERQPMTAGGGLVTEERYNQSLTNETSSQDEFSAFFRARLGERISETVSPLAVQSQASFSGPWQLPPMIRFIVLASVVVSVAISYVSAGFN